MSQIETPEIVRKAATETAEPQYKRPPMYRVVMLNDDFTPMDFVIEVLVRFFHKSEQIANTLMLQIHNEGSARCGVFTRDIAETKMQQVETASRTSGHPLRCIIEIDSED
ncbi:ATP-dependent Clp protease adapter ClpS [Mariprofundus sp. EBB-1]|uniref:ATP-dependent Clp protease adapter ClpS n=1 Tax=Mariprofundus sp. EBB-1 TaxID=2650971 RepID=UPI000EF29324|nr:ATP-dependent Clp protease adapter ClpS [Mariprofundus sp. EBB-1]RLL51074.1 ATP-dependent Clp protease adapter ClpS [Mariprofundus sp. EBB-1]